MNISIHNILKLRDLTLGRLTCPLLSTLIGADVARLVGPVVWEMDAKAPTLAAWTCRSGQQ